MQAQRRNAAEAMRRSQPTGLRQGHSPRRSVPLMTLSFRKVAYRSWAIASPIALLLLSAAAAFSQMNTAEVAGVVVDPAGATIPDATIQRAQPRDSGEVQLHNERFWRISAPADSPGRIHHHCKLPGLQTSHSGTSRPSCERSRPQDFSLQLGAPRNPLSCKLQRTPVQTESAEIKDVVQNQQVLDLPLKDREFLQLALLSEGVVNPPGGTRGDSLQQTGSLINVLGQRTGHNLFLVDGVSVTDEYFNNVVLNPSPDEIQEFLIDKTNYDAEFGGKSGAVVNVITRSGTDHTARQGCTNSCATTS